jgi:O-antigen/teichoic acid export membrane protein
MTRFQVAGILWLAAAIIGAAMTIVFRDDVALAVTLVASVIGALIGIGLIWRPGIATVGLSSILGVAWVVTYGVLTVIQSADIQAWTADAFVGLVGATAAIVAYSARRASV